MTSSATGFLPSTTPERARYTWPRRLLVGVLLVAVAVAAVVVPSAGARLVLGAAGLAAAGRGALLVRAADAVAIVDGARRLGALLAAAGVAAVVVAVLTATGSGRALVVAVPLVLFLATGALLGQGADSRAARRGGQVLGVWSLVFAALLVVAGVVRGWAGAAAVATGVGAVALAGLGVALLVGAVTLRAVAARPSTAGAYPAPAGGCGGCACGAGGCGGSAEG